MVTLKDLKNRVKLLNSLKNTENKTIYYSLIKAFSGFAVVIVDPKDNTEYDFLNTGYKTKEEIYNILNAFILGIKSERVKK